MSFRNTSTAYGSVAKFFHWAIFLLVLGMIPIGYFMGDISNPDLRGQVINLHKCTGLAILVLMILRLLWALMNAKPKLAALTAKWQIGMEHGMHFLLYLGLILMPLSGWIGSVAGGRLPHIGDISFSLPLAQNKELAKFAFAKIHEPLAIVLIVLISIHILAALYHHFIKKDDILRRMLPHRSQH